MEILFISEDGNVFGETHYLGLGKRRPKQIYGIKAQELREKAEITLEDLAKEFRQQPKQLEAIEKQEKGMSEALMQKYIEKFGVEKEFFFDTDLETLILGDNGLVLKTFDNSTDCKRAFEMILSEFALRKQDNIKNVNVFVDFREVR